MDDLLHSLPEPFAASDLTLVEDIIQETISPSSSSNRNVTNGDGDQIKRDNSYFNSYQDTIILRDKILLLGDKATGKTSLVQTLLEFTNGGDGGGITRDYYQNQDSYQMTKGLEMNVATLSLDDSQEENMNSGSGIPKNFQVDLFLYEMGGQSIFHSHTTAKDSNRISTGATATATATSTKMEQVISKHCSCVMFVFDVSCRKSLQNVIQWMDMMMKLNGERSDDIPMILVGTKVDLRQDDDSLDDCVGTEEGIQFAKEYGMMEYFECSCNAGSMEEAEAPFRFIANQSASTRTDRYQSRDVNMDASY